MITVYDKFSLLFCSFFYLLNPSFDLNSQVHLQTQQKAKEGLVSMGIKVFKNEGFIGLYNGVSASILRQV